MKQASDGAEKEERGQIVSFVPVNCSTEAGLIQGTGAGRTYF